MPNNWSFQSSNRLITPRHVQFTILRFENANFEKMVQLRSTHDQTTNQHAHITSKHDAWAKFMTHLAMWIFDEYVATCFGATFDKSLHSGRCRNKFRQFVIPNQICCKYVVVWNLNPTLHYIQEVCSILFFTRINANLRHNENYPKLITHHTLFLTLPLALHLY
jgi:hypothetical protein